MRRDGYALLMVLGLALTVGLAAALVAVRTAQEAEQSRLEADRALAQVALDGRYNELLLLLGNQIREELRNLLAEHGGGGRFAFGDGTDAPSQSSVAADLTPLQQQMQARADALLCAQGYRLYFTGTACGEALPPNVALAQPGFVSGSPRTGGPAAIQRYRLPFVAYARGESGEARQERYVSGAYEFDLGAALPSRYALLIDNAYDEAGNLHLFDSQTVLEGRLHVAGLLGVRDGPWFAGPVSSGSCPSLGVDGGCVGAPTPGMAFSRQGFVGIPALLPRPDRPCLGADCPVWGEGIDFQVSDLRVGSFALSGWLPSLSLPNSAQRVRLWPEGGMQHLEICDTSCYTFSGVPSGATPTLRLVSGAGTLATFNGSASYELAPGSYTLQADAIQSGGYTYTPSGQGTFSVTAGQTTTLNVRYNATTGRLRVVTSGLPFAPNYGLSGPQSLSVSQADQTFDDLPPGIYAASPNTRDQDVGGGVVYRYRAGLNLVGQGEVAGLTALAPDRYRLADRDGFPGGWVSVGAGQMVGVYGCIDNRSGYPAQIGLMETLSDGSSPLWTASGWQRGLWVMPSQQGCIETTLPVSNRSGVRVRPFLNIDGPWGNVGGYAEFSSLRVTLIGGGPSATVEPGQTATLYVHYTPTGSVVLQINRTSNNAPVSVVFNGQTYTAPGRYVLNYLTPGSYPLQKNTTYYQGLAYYPSGPDPVLLPGGARTVEAVVTYTPENRAVLNLTVERQYQDSRFANLWPPGLPILQSGNLYYQAGVGSHTLSLYPNNTYSSQWGVGYEVYAAQFGCGLFCHDDLSYYIKAVSGLPLVPWAGEVYSARVVWGTKICWRRWFSYTCQSY